MKQQSAIRNVSPRATTLIRKFWSLLPISIAVTLCMAADNTTTARYNDLGHRMMCACDSAPAAMGPRGCRQVLLKCNHLNCDTSGPMRRELGAALEKGDKDDVILHSFVQKYGASVLVMPSMSDMSKVAWIVALAVVATTAASIVIAFSRKRQSSPAMVTTPLSNLQGIQVDALRRRVREETENDDG